MATKYVGARIKRTEDPRLITGQGLYIDDLQLPGTLYLSVLRSVHAHARLTRVDLDRALARPEVVAAITGKDLLPLGSIPSDVPVPGMPPPPKPFFAVDRVLYVGEPVAAVVATDRYAARDAVDLIEVDYAPMPAITDPERALEDDAPVLHPDRDTNLAFHLVRESGEVDRAFQEAEVTVSLRLENQRLAPVPLEPRATLAVYDEDREELTIWLGTQTPSSIRTMYARALGLPESQVRVVVRDLGGGFGAKSAVYPEELATAYLALTLRRPIKWVETRSENLQAMTHGRAQVTYIDLAATRDGTITALRTHGVADLGAFLQRSTAAPAGRVVQMGVGAYNIPTARCEIRGAFTNKVPTAPYRGAGRPEASYAVERAVDALARKLDLDPAELRLRNFIPPDDFPHQTPTGVVYDSGDYARALHTALEMIGYQRWREEQRRARERGEYIGIGLSSYVEASAPFWESGRVRVEPTGKVLVMTGSSAHGQGHETTFAQIVADELAVPMEDVEVLHGDTAIIPVGIGTFGSRSTALGGSAALLAARDVREQMLALAGTMLEASPADVDLADGQFSVRGAPGRAISFAAVARRAYEPRPGTDAEPGLDATRKFEAGKEVYPFGTHIAVVRVDPDTGEIAFLGYVGVDDCGRVINPLLADGQVHGGLAQGLGQALLEAVIYDEDGQLLTGTLMDYGIPTARQLPHFELETQETPSPRNPLGAKGVGEAGTIAAPQAVVNAVLDALAPLGVDHLEMPLTPPRVWAAIQAAKTRHEVQA